MTKYTVRKIKTFKGEDCPGFNAELMRDGVPVAFVIESGNGCEPQFDWYDRENKRFYDMKRENGEVVKVAIPAEEALLRDHIKSMTYDSYDGAKEPMTPDIFVAGLVDEHQKNVIMKRKCKTSTCFRLVGQEEGCYMTMAVIFTKELGDKLRKQYGERLDYIYNEKLKEA